MLVLPWAVAQPKNIKPDPNGLPPQDVKDLHYGDVLFYFYQDDYFDSITRLLAARQLNRVPHTQGEAELLLGGLYLSLGEHVEAGRIFEALLKQNTSEAVRNRAWFYLGKVWYQRGYLEESERALRQVSDKMDPRIDAERYMLIAQLMMKQGRYDDAIAALSNWHGAPDWTAYAQFNLGVALVRRERLTEAARYLDRVGTMQTRSPELLALKDKANLALGFALLQAHPARRPVFKQGAARRRLGGCRHGRIQARAGAVARAAQAQLAGLGGSRVLSHRALCIPAIVGHRAGRRILQFGDRILRFRKESDR